MKREQSAEEKRVFDLIQENETKAAMAMFEEKLVDINCLDDSGMTPLDQACYKGNKELVEYLIERGADPNSNEHSHGYTALMFAALAGKPESPEICRLLLDAGAHSYATNSIHKTAAELAAFVGQHECVSVINSYISIEDIDKIVHPRGKDSEEQFPPDFCRLLHAVTRSHQIHPVKIILYVHDNELILKYRKKYVYVVDRLFERQLRTKESNEVMSLKLWIILFVLRETLKFVDSKSESGKTVPQLLQLYIKFLLKMEPEDRVRPNLETLLRNAVRAFPYHHLLLFQSLVRAIAQTKFGDRPDAYHYVAQGLFGQRLAMTANFCSTCGAPNAKKCCPTCKLPYCCTECQKLDWSIHKKCCVAIAERLHTESKLQNVVLPELEGTSTNETLESRDGDVDFYEGSEGRSRGDETVQNKDNVEMHQKDLVEEKGGLQDTSKELCDLNDIDVSNVSLKDAAHEK